jgi:hypothetical protein
LLILPMIAIPTIECIAICSLEKIVTPSPSLEM